MPTSNIICPCCRCYEDSCHCKDFVFRERIRELEAEQLTITTLKEILHRVREEKYELELEHEKLRAKLDRISTQLDRIRALIKEPYRGEEWYMGSLRGLLRAIEEE